MDETKWIYLDTHQAHGVWFDEYVNEDGTLGKHEWYDGYTEVYEIRKKDIDFTAGL